MILTSNLDGSTANINVDPNIRYGILLSGGIDSTVLLFALLKEYQLLKAAPNIKCFTIPKLDGSYLYVNNIITRLNEIFSVNLEPTMLIGDISQHHSLQVKNTTKDIFETETIDELFIATNQNPPEDDFDYNQFAGKVINNRFKELTERIHQPFLFLYKSHIIDFMYQFNAEEFVNLTHSCTRLTDTRCGVCFQCHERAWAFLKNQKADTGLF